MLWRGQMSFRLLLHAVLLYTILMCIIKIRSDLFRITVYLELGVGLTLGDLTDEASDTYTGYYSWSK